MRGLCVFIGIFIGYFLAPTITAILQGNVYVLMALLGAVLILTIIFRILRWFWRIVVKSEKEHKPNPWNGEVDGDVIPLKR